MLITPEYVSMNKALFATEPLYGVSGSVHRNMVRVWSKWGRKSVLDYGCGRQTLKTALGPAYDVTCYDPCVEGCDLPPQPCDIVYCGDVLEHVEPECLDDVLADLLRVTKEFLIAIISMAESTQTLADGRNAHLIQKDKDWWKDRLEAAGFEIVQTKLKEKIVRQIWYVCKPKVTNALQ